MTLSFTRTEVRPGDQAKDVEPRAQQTQTFDPVALLADGRRLWNTLPSINDSFALLGLDSKNSQSKYQIERNEAGRPATVKDSQGNLIYSISYDEKGAVKEVRFDKGTDVNGKMMPSYLRPGTEAGSWDWFDANGKLTSTGFGTFDVDKDANIIFKPVVGSEIRQEPDGTQEYVRRTREDWPERAKDATVVKNANGFEVRDKNGQPLRTVVTDKSGIVSITEADGSTWTRNADGKSWDRKWFNNAYGGTAYNLKVDEKGNISYEQNLGGYRDQGKPIWSNKRELVNEYIDGRVRYSPK